MKRILVLGMLALGMAVLGPLSAGAAPSETVSVTLSCDRGVSATAWVAFFTDVGGASRGEVPAIHCGGDASNRVRVVVAVPPPVGAVSVIQFTVESDASVSCGDPSVTTPTPLRLDCPNEGPGARLVVR